MNPDFSKAERRAYAIGRADAARAYQSSLTTALDEVKANAWDEGMAAAQAVADDCCGCTITGKVTNPHRPADTTEGENRG